MQGVYRILNTVTGQVYIGSTGRDLVERFGVHRRLLRTRRHPNYRLQAAYDRHGPGAFVYEVLEPIANPTRRLNREGLLIDRAALTGVAYNLRGVLRHYR